MMMVIIYSFSEYLSKIFTAAQPISIQFIFSVENPASVNGDALVSTDEIMSISSDGKHHFDLIQSFS